MTCITILPTVDCTARASLWPWRAPFFINSSWDDTRHATDCMLVGLWWGGTQGFQNIFHTFLHSSPSQSVYRTLVRAHLHVAYMWEWGSSTVSLCAWTPPPHHSYRGSLQGQRRCCWYGYQRLSLCLCAFVIKASIAFLASHWIGLLYKNTAAAYCSGVALGE